MRPFYTDPGDEPLALTKEGKAHLTYPHEPCALYSVRGAKFIRDAFDLTRAKAAKNRKKRAKVKAKVPAMQASRVTGCKGDEL